ncbi:hypothetical protein C8Q75DRAFT_788124 [Abortiporus biennis]|nr:hypothetical protein C8Q75DRAFT_788124 [Abortiporus biennis]
MAGQLWHRLVATVLTAGVYLKLCVAFCSGSLYLNSFPRDIIYNPPIIPRIKVKPSWVLSKCPSEYDLGQEKEYRKCRFPKLVTFDLLSSGSSRGIPLVQCGSMLELVDGKDYVLSESPSEEITVGLYVMACLPRAHISCHYSDAHYYSGIRTCNPRIYRSNACRQDSSMVHCRARRQREIYS